MKDKLVYLWDEFVGYFIESVIFIVGLVAYMGTLIKSITDSA